MYMELEYFTIIWSIFNIVLLGAILIGIYKGVKSFKSFIVRNKEMDKKLDIILSKLENKN